MTRFLRLALLLAFAVAAHARPKLVQSLDVQIPVPPSPVVVAGKRVLAYELHLTNLRPAGVTLTRVEIRDAIRKTRLVEYRDAELAARLGRPGFRPAPADKRLLGAGLRAVLYVWLALDDSVDLPARLQHVIESDSVIEGAEVEVRAEPAVVLDAPLRGGPWVALYDPLMSGGHRTAIYA